MSKFDIDWLKTPAEIMPPKKRGTIRVKFVYRLLAWVRKIHGEFVALVDELTYQSKITSEVIIFESYLIDLFGDGITITVNEIAAVEAFVADDEDADLGFEICDDDDDYAGSYINDEDTIELYNFTVNVPAGLSADIEQMRSIINNYKVPGSNFNIIES